MPDVEKQAEIQDQEKQEAETEGPVAIALPDAAEEKVEEHIYVKPKLPKIPTAAQLRNINPVNAKDKQGNTGSVTAVATLMM